MSHDPYSQGGGFYPPASGGAAAGVFRGFDAKLPAFTPAGTGGFVTRWVASIAYASVWVVGAVAGAISANGSAADEAAGVMTLCAMVPLLVYVLASLTWIYQSWDFLPYEMRRTASGRTISPGRPWALFIPLYNLYWMFVIAPGLCDALNAALAQQGRPQSAPRQLAVAACVVQIVPYINWLVGPVLWITYMFMVDRAKRDLTRTS